MFSFNKRSVFASLVPVIVLGVALLTIIYLQKNSSHQIKTYHDEKYGFSVSYPANWTLNGSKTEEQSAYLSFSGPKQPYYNGFVYIDIISNTTLSEWMKEATLKEMPDTSRPKIVREFTLGSRKAFQIESDAGDGGSWHNLVVVIPPNLINMYSSYRLEDEIRVYDSMVSSFQMTK